jgi:2-phosphoglycerate kinase
MNKIILIGGSPTAGKSYAARKLANVLKFPWISTDMIREQMRQIVREEDYPQLFSFTKIKPRMVADYFRKNSAAQIVKHQNEESREVWKGVRGIVETDYVWGSFIVEGVAILPSLVKKLAVKNKTIKAVFLIDEDVERVRRAIFTRGLWDAADKYSDMVKEKEVAWVLAFNKYLLAEAKKYGLPIIKIGDRRQVAAQIRELTQ